MKTVDKLNLQTNFVFVQEQQMICCSKKDCCKKYKKKGNHCKKCPKL